MTETTKLKKLALDALEELKAEDIRVLDVQQLTSITDTMVIASGRSTRHVKSIADNVVERAKAARFQVFGVEGQGTAEWILVDLGDVVVHVMLPDIRDFYGLEKLWAVDGDEAARSV